MIEMKRIIISIAALCLSFSALWAAEKLFKEPILLTSCGQSADVLMMKTLMARDSLNFEYLANAKADDVAGNGSVVLVLGGSSKGLGAAKISEADESARVAAIVETAHKAKIPILAVHLGGMNRRGALSDPFNRLGAEAAQRILVVKGGNDDGLFSKIAEEKKIPLDTLGIALDLAPMLKEIYRSSDTTKTE